MEEELRRKDEQNVNLLSELELVKEQNQEIQTRTTEAMSSLLHDLSDMRMAVNPENTAELSPKKVESLNSGAYGTSLQYLLISHLNCRL